MTMSTPRSPHGRAAGSFSLRTLISRPSMIDRVVGVVDRAGIGAVRRVVLEEERVELGVDEVVDGDDLDLRGALDERLERLAADAAEAVDADANGHRGFLPGARRPGQAGSPAIERASGAGPRRPHERICSHRPGPRRRRPSYDAGDRSGHVPSAGSGRAGRLVIRGPGVLPRAGSPRRARRRRRGPPRRSAPAPPGSRRRGPRTAARAGSSQRSPWPRATLPPTTISSGANMSTKLTTARANPRRARVMIATASGSPATSASATSRAVNGAGARRSRSGAQVRAPDRRRSRRARPGRSRCPTRSPRDGRARRTRTGDRRCRGSRGPSSPPTPSGPATSRPSATIAPPIPVETVR